LDFNYTNDILIADLDSNFIDVDNFYTKNNQKINCLMCKNLIEEDKVIECPNCKNVKNK